MSRRRRSGPASPAPGASSCRSRCRAVVGFIFLLALSTHLPNLSTLFPTRLPIRLGDLQPVLLRRRRGRHRHPRLQPRTDGRRHPVGAGIAIAMCVLRPLVGRLGRADAVRVQPRRRRPRLRLAQEGLAPLPDAGQRADRDRRGRLAVHGRRVLRRAGGGGGSIIVTAISTIFLYAAYGIVIYLGRDDRRTGCRSGSGASAAGRSRSPGSRSSGSSS